MSEWKLLHRWKERHGVELRVLVRPPSKGSEPDVALETRSVDLLGGESWQRVDVTAWTRPEHFLLSLFYAIRSARDDAEEASTP